MVYTLIKTTQDNSETLQHKTIHFYDRTMKKIIHILMNTFKLQKTKFFIADENDCINNLVTEMTISGNLRK